MNFEQFKDIVMAYAKEKGLAEYELYFQGGESVCVTVFGHEVDAFESTNQGGVCFRCIVDGKMGYASTESCCEEEARAIVDRAMDNASVLESQEQVFLTPGGLTYEAPQPASYALPSTHMLIQKALALQEAQYAAHPAVVDGTSVRTVADTTTVAISNSLGLNVCYSARLAAALAEAVAEKNGEKATHHKIIVGDLEAMDLDAVAKETATVAYNKLDSDIAPTGSYPVVFDPEAVAGLLQVFSSAFSAEAAQKGLSRLADREGEVVAATCVTLTDDPFCAQSPMPMPFDAEGSPTHKKNVIASGTLRTLLHNRKTANVAGCQTTGNAAKAGYDAPMAIRPFTMYLEPGDISREELLQMAGNGVYINQLEGLHAGASPVTGDFSLQSGGYLIEDGKLTKPVKSFTVAGNFFQLLKDITALSDTVVLPRATGATSFGGPCVLVTGLSIAGK